MKKSCTICGRIHEKNEPCPYKPKSTPKSRYRDTKRYRDRQASAVKFRSSPEWTKKAIAIKKRDNYCCAVCLDGKYPLRPEEDIFTAETFSGEIINFSQLEVHHIIKASESISKRLDNTNLITLCVRHHKQADNGQIPKKYLQSLAQAAEDKAAAEANEAGFCQI